MTAGGFRRLPVMEGDKKLVGMISERDVRQHLGYLAETKVNAAMASSPVSIPEFETAESATKLMLQHNIGGLPVINDGRVVGILTTTDLLKALLNVVQAAGDILKQ
jgi:acetoin utilization protein AcuB